MATYVTLINFIFKIQFPQYIRKPPISTQHTQRTTHKHFVYQQKGQV